MIYLLICAICIGNLQGCIPRGIPIEVYVTVPKIITKETKIIYPYKSKEKAVIKAIMIESGLSEPEAVILWGKYIQAKTEEINTLAKYMINIQYSPNKNGFSLRYDLFENLVERVKVRTRMLKRKRYEK